MIAEPPPPPLQILAHPYFPLFYCITVIKLYTILAPEKPIGCPKETAPPLTLTLSSPMSNSFILAKVVAANASFISWKSIYPIFILALYKANCTALAGATQKSIGSTSASA